MKANRTYFLLLFSMAVPVLAGPSVLLATDRDLGYSSLTYRSLARKDRNGDEDINEITTPGVKFVTIKLSGGPPSLPKTGPSFVLHFRARIGGTSLWRERRPFAGASGLCSGMAPCYSGNIFASVPAGTVCELLISNNSGRGFVSRFLLYCSFQL
jgi:hypothetical protein